MRFFPFSGAIFDLDGTLLDSMGLWYDIDTAFLKRRGIAPPADYAVAVAHLGLNGAAEYTIKRFGLNVTPLSLIGEWTEMAATAYRTSIELKPGVRRFLDELKQDGVKMGVATSLIEPLFEPCLKRLGVYNLFECFATVEEAGRGKDSPDVYLLAAERLFLKPSQILVFEDVAAAALGAVSGGFKVCGVGGGEEKSELMKVCNSYIENFD